MCWIRPVYFSCNHEDMNVTPPRPRTPCPHAILRGSVANPIYCGLALCGRRSLRDTDENIYRDGSCARCEEKGLRYGLDKDWDKFVKQNVLKVTTSEMLFYMKQREAIFEDPDTHYWDWDQMHSILLEKCKQDIEAKYSTNGAVD
ncbi:hypothetical protein F4820DRAFT_451296 [Hypoxylon rubiginosum]|uniref:Uncharacterized protein n=1 Tax=Hypoxylon rubiginosum TaxID=110542 RepID=A0ACB9YRN8_9PEZI|nr:hypothetical protein F4820DRAFT_451296 [Hypoxylon rubiginosum]